MTVRRGDQRTSAPSIDLSHFYHQLTTNKMRSGGRPSVAPVQLKDGYYIEVCDKGSKKGIKIWSSSAQAMDLAARGYASYKTVIVLGEFRDGDFQADPVIYK